MKKLFLAIIIAGVVFLAVFYFQKDTSQNAGDLTPANIESSGDVNKDLEQIDKDLEEIDSKLDFDDFQEQDLGL